MMASVGALPGGRGGAAGDDDADSVAVVSMACRYPRADSPEALWELLAKGEDAIGVVDRARWRPVREPERKEDGDVEYMGTYSSSAAASSASSAATAAAAAKVKTEGGRGGGGGSGNGKARASSRRGGGAQQQQQRKRGRGDEGKSMAKIIADEALPCVVAASLAAPEAWDAGFFELSDGEAAAMDPQHRLALEVATQAFQNAGYSRAALKGQRVGVFVAMSNPEWGELPAGRAACVGAAALVEGAPPAATHAAQRISHFYHLKGPSMVVNSGCSSSLSALDMAATALRQGRCTAALVVGVHLLLGPRSAQDWRHVGLLSPSGEGVVFAPNADGFVLGEGAGAVLLETVAQAKARGHTALLGKLRASVVEFGSPFNTSPEEVRARLLELMELARAEAGLPAAAAGAAAAAGNAKAGGGAAGAEARLIDYAEISGAGRTVFDAREAACLAAVYGGGLASPNPSQGENGGNGDGSAVASAAAAAGEGEGEGLIGGCIKSNLGHMDAASGMAGLLKAMLVLKHRAAPPQPRLAQGPHQEFLSLGVTVPTGDRLVPIAPAEGAPARPLRVAVTSLAWSGTNAHVLVEECVAAAGGGGEDGVESMLATGDDDQKEAAEQGEGLLRKRPLPPLEMRRRPFPWWHVDHAPPPPEPEEEEEEEEEEAAGETLSQDSEATQQPRAPKCVSWRVCACGGS